MARMSLRGIAIANDHNDAVDHLRACPGALNNLLAVEKAECIVHESEAPKLTGWESTEAVEHIPHTSPVEVEVSPGKVVRLVVGKRRERNSRPLLFQCEGGEHIPDKSNGLLP